MVKSAQEILATRINLNDSCRTINERQIMKRFLLLGILTSVCAMTAPARAHGLFSFRLGLPGISVGVAVPAPPVCIAPPVVYAPRPLVIAPPAIVVRPPSIVVPAPVIVTPPPAVIYRHHHRYVLVPPPFCR